MSYRRLALVASAAVGSLAAALALLDSEPATTAPAPVSLEQVLVRVVQRVAPSVVEIESGGGLGSGVVYDRNGNIVTNAHVVGESSQFVVTLANGRRARGTLVGRFEPEDLAVVRISATGLRPARFESSSNVRVGEFALAIGSPLGLRSSVTEGIISAVARVVPQPGGGILPNVIQTSAPINPGNSGGALVDLNGRVIGIPTLGIQGGAGIGFAIAADRVRLIAGQLIRHGRVLDTGRAYLGVLLGDFSDGRGVVVAEVVAGGPADRAGLRAGDIIAAVAGRATPTPADLGARLGGLRPGQRVNVQLIRDGRRTQVSVTLGRVPASG